MLTKVAIPNDGHFHACPACGEGQFRVWDCDGWRDPVPTDDEGRWHDDCPACGVEFAVVEVEPTRLRTDVPVTADDFRLPASDEPLPF